MKQGFVAVFILREGWGECVFGEGSCVSQNRKNYMIYDIFKAFLYHKMREIEAFMIFFPRSYHKTRIFEAFAIF